MGKTNDSPSLRLDPQPFFPHLPPYKAPSTGILSHVPRRLLPYVELARVDKPGFTLLWTVHTFGILHAGIMLRAPLSEVLHLVAFFLPASGVLMCLNFAWNDSCDFRFDAKVARTRHRPLVRGAVSLPAAITFDCALAITLASFLLPLPRACAVYAMPMALGCFLYPLSKRWTNYPQLVLAVVLPSGVFMGAAAVGATPLPYPPHPATVLDLATWRTSAPGHAPAILWSYLTNVVWTVLFEVVYSFQDAPWDERAGIGTITVSLKRRGTAKAFLLALAVAQTALHAQTGTATQAHSALWPLSVALTFATLVTQIFCVRLDEEESCMFWFAAGNGLTGLAMLVGYAGEYYTRTLERDGAAV